MQKMILLANGQHIALIGSFEPPIPNPINVSPAALKDAYNGLSEAVVTLEMQLEMTTDKNFWFGFDLSRQACIEQFQKNNRDLLPGTLIGAIK